MLVESLSASLQIPKRTRQAVGRFPVIEQLVHAVGGFDFFESLDDLTVNLPQSQTYLLGRPSLVTIRTGQHP